MRIVFMGTAEFAVASLKALLEAGHTIVAVVTAPDKPAGRGNKLRQSPVKQYALEQGLRVLQPTNLKSEAFTNELTKLKPELGVVVAFRMLPEVVWQIPEKGTFNLHASLLPDYRGAAPINWVLINGESETGVTTFMIDRKIDTGEILLQERQKIGPDWDAGQLHDTLMVLGAKLVTATAEGIESDTLSPSPQDHALSVHPAPKIYKETCRVDWRKPSIDVYNFIRGLSPYPGAWTTLNGQIVKLYTAILAKGLHEPLVAGKIHLEGNRLFVACQDGWLEILTLQASGKKRMATAAFLAGFRDPIATFE